MNSTVPANNSPLQHALAKLTERETAAVSRQLDPARCDPGFLPFHAFARSIGTEEGWDFAETDEARRNLIAGFAEIHARKGTPYAIRALFPILRLGEIQIIERDGEFKWDGSVLFDGSRTFGRREGRLGGIPHCLNAPRQHPPNRPHPRHVGGNRPLAVRTYRARLPQPSPPLERQNPL